MAYVMKAEELIELLKKAADGNSLYVMGAWGAVASDENKQKYAYNSYDYNKKRKSKILAASRDTFFFDCVCLIKGILWGWIGDINQRYGGAVYASHGVPDIGEDQMINQCKNVSTDFSSILPGCAVWISGHIGIYIGEGLVIESTPSWEDGVQRTALGNLGKISGYNARTWTKHGQLPYVDYSGVLPKPAITVDGYWGKDTTRWTQKMLGTPVDGVVSAQPLSVKKYLTRCATASWKFSLFGRGSQMVRVLQRYIGMPTAEQDGICGKKTVIALQEYLNGAGYDCGQADGYLGANTVRAWQRYVNDFYKQLKTIEDR